MACRLYGTVLGTGILRSGSSAVKCIFRRPNEVSGTKKRHRSRQIEFFTRKMGAMLQLTHGHQTRVRMKDR